MPLKEDTPGRRIGDPPEAGVVVAAAPRASVPFTSET